MTLVASCMYASSGSHTDKINPITDSVASCMYASSGRTSNMSYEDYILVAISSKMCNLKINPQKFVFWESENKKVNLLAGFTAVG